MYTNRNYQGTQSPIEKDEIPMESAMENLGEGSWEVISFPRKATKWHRHYHGPVSQRHQLNKEAHNPKSHNHAGLAQKEWDKPAKGERPNKRETKIREEKSRQNENKKSTPTDKEKRVSASQLAGPQLTEMEAQPTITKLNKCHLLPSPLVLSKSL